MSVDIAFAAIDTDDIGGFLFRPQERFCQAAKRRSTEAATEPETASEPTRAATRLPPPAAPRSPAAVPRSAACSESSASNVDLSELELESISDNSSTAARSVPTMPCARWNPVKRERHVPVDELPDDIKRKRRKRAIRESLNLKSALYQSKSKRERIVPTGGCQTKPQQSVKSKPNSLYGVEWIAYKVSGNSDSNCVLWAHSLKEYFGRYSWRLLESKATIHLTRNRDIPYGSDFDVLVCFSNDGNEHAGVLISVIRKGFRAIVRLVCTAEYKNDADSTNYTLVLGQGDAIFQQLIVELACLLLNISPSLPGVFFPPSSGIIAEFLHGKLANTIEWDRLETRNFSISAEWGSAKVLLSFLSFL
ncbi:hypothetical protein BDR26DRAFT_855226 [Obelidium mucronatum]|nr:hypothetical protein BDR26DRAFT_855226 [Obelidium mucronatum]